VLARVFEPFFTTKESGKGTGLGLSMVYGFVRQSGGHVEIDSAPERGTTIRILMPRAKERGSPIRPATVISPARGHGETILVVEDDPKVRQVTVSALRSLGFQVREAENGDEAVVSLNRNNGVDLVLSDVKMPGSLNGTELAKQVQENWPEIKILLTSGYVDAEEDIEQFNIIFKPYRVSELAERVHSLLNTPAVQTSQVA
jgi:CheY-like chemotaxis protein